MWVVDPAKRVVLIRGAGAPERWLSEAESLDGGEVLPEFVLATATDARYPAARMDHQRDRSTLPAAARNSCCGEDNAAHVASTHPVHALVALADQDLLCTPVDPAERMHLQYSLIGCLLLASALSACGPGSSAQAVAETAKATLTTGTTRAAAKDDSIHARGEARVVARSATVGGATPDTAMFAGGCFWSMERPFQHVPGVLATTVGYAGGTTANPTYEQVNTRKTGHTETVRVEYDPSRVSYEKLLDVYWHNIDPVTKDRQFCDGGSDYRTVIFTHSADQQAKAVASKAALDRAGHFKAPVVTEIVANASFWRGEEYHQHFADRNPDRYDAYRRGCGRDARLRELWGNAASPFVPAP